MRIVGEMEMWSWGAVRCVLIHHEDPRGLLVQVRRHDRILAKTPCANPDRAAVEAERFYRAVTGTTNDDFIPKWFQQFRRRGTDRRGPR
jgi:hypothetical protein